MELEDLPDNEIRQRLIALGQNVGPLTPTTRAVHIKKLRNLMAMQGENAITVHEPTPPPSYSSGDGTNQLEIMDSEPILEDDQPLTQLRAPLEVSETPRASKVVAPQPRVSAIMIVVVLMALVVFVFYLSDRVHRQTAGGAADEEL
uniref:LEM domain-containing protein n=1 Tax=Haemonchus contortus TaxID=6289 RepID=A0A7I4XYF5_HAECO